LFLNGKAIPPMMSANAPKHSNYDTFSETVKAGMNLIIMRYPYGGPAIHGSWKGENSYDFSDLDQNMYKVLMQNPNATLILSIDGLYPPLWWGQQNTDELLRDQKGNYVLSRSESLYQKNIGPMEFLNKIAEEAKTVKGGRYHWFGARGPRAFYIPSNASEAYAKTMTDFLIALRRHIESQPYGKAVAGYRLCQGYDTQWGEPYYDRKKEDPHFFDYSTPMLNRFKAYLKLKYKTDKALQKAWNNQAVTFNSVEIPGIERRDIDQHEEKVFLLNPDKYQDVIDFRDTMADLKSSLLLTFCKAIKDAGEKEVITLSYWPILQVSGAPINMKHIAKTMNSPYLDVYGGWSGVMHASNGLHDKLFMREMDTRVFTVVKQSYANGKLFETAQETINELRRLYTLQMCTGSGSWVYDLGFGWYNDPLVMEIIGDARNVYEKTLQFDRSPNAKMAVFAGNYSKHVQADGRRGMIPKVLLLANGFQTLFYAGTPVDQYYMCDLKEVSKNYNIFYFPLDYGLRPEEMEQIELLKKNGNVLVFGYGAGYVSDRKSLKNVEKVTGIKMGIDPSINNLTVKAKTDSHVLTSSLVGYLGYGDSKLFTGVPKIYVDDPSAISLGTFANSEERTGMAVKDHGSWKSIYLGFIGYVPPQLFRNIATFGGQHIYNQNDDRMYFNKSLIGINASSTGEKTITLPAEAKVTSLWDDKYIGPVKEIVRDMETGENALYLIEYVK